MNRKTLAVACAIGAAALATSSPASAATDLLVDDDRQQCKKAQFTTIQAAVLAADPGDTVQVCPGAYTGPVVVPKPLTVSGPRGGNADAPSRDDLAKEAVVTNAGAGGFDVLAGDVAIRGFTITGTAAPSVAYPDAGIYARTGTGRDFTANVIRENGLGIYFEGVHAESVVERNRFVANRRGANPFRIPSGGIFAAGGQLNDVAIEENAFTASEQFAVNIGDGSAGGLTVSRNDLVDETTPLVLGRAVDARVERNRGRRLTGGILLFGSNRGVTIAHNDLEGLPGNGATGIRSQLFTAFGADIVPDTDLTIEHNRLSTWGFDGIAVRGTVSSTVQKNRIDDAVRNGIRADRQASGNTITKNDVGVTGVSDCFDDTLGPGTAGTANFWSDTRADTENRPGLCVARR